MKNKIFLVFFLIIGLGIWSTNLALAKDFELGKKTNKDNSNNLNYVPGEIIVKYKNDKVNLQKNNGVAEVAELKSKLSLKTKEEFKNFNIQVLKSEKSIDEVIKELKKDPNVEYAEPNYLRYPAEITTNDTNRGLLWGLDNTGQNVNGTTGTVDKDIDAPAAWGLSEGNGVIVAVIDTGVAYNHPDLINNMWNGSGCLDESGNALGGCNHGYDFEDNDKTPLPTTSAHGTHVAGIIAAEKNNSKGIIGVAPQTKIMALKSNLSVAENVKAIDFAIKNGAKIINASYTGSNFSQTEYDAINRFKTAGGIFVAAAGNESNNNDTTPYYPASYDLDNIISVAATDQNDNLASFSNYGSTSVDVAAPGVNIYSTVASKTSLITQNFESASVPNVPSGWTKTGNWATTYIMNGDNVEKALIGDNHYPYDNNANTTIDSPTYDLGNGDGTSISFLTQCDTPLSETSWLDYMQLEFSNNGGSSYTPVSRWDESYLDSSRRFLTFSIPPSYATSNFKFRFRWVTDGSDNNYHSCIIDDISIDRFSDGSDEQYEYKDGTSMATPFVVGEVADLMSKYPTMPITDVKNVLINTGADTLTSLSGKTVYGKRLNLYRALLSNETYPAGSVFRFWSDNNYHHFYTISKNERDKVASVYYDKVWRYEHVSYVAFTEVGQDRIPLYRFWSDNYQGHFYTSNETEKNKIIASNPNWRYEQIAYYVYGSGYTGPSTPVYRFWSDNYRGHFYTSNETEMNNVKNNNPNWRYEGVAFKVAAN